MPKGPDTLEFTVYLLKEERDELKRAMRRDRRFRSLSAWARAKLIEAAMGTERK